MAASPTSPKNDHSFLAQKATRFLMRELGCFIGAFEFAGGFTTDERPDGIAYFEQGSVLVEAKVSRGDFLADARKPFRRAGAGIGRFRYFAAPKGLISVDELPAGWGLVEMGARNKCELVWGFRSARQWEPVGGPSISHYRDMLTHWAFDDRDLVSENACLAYLAKRYKTRRHMDNIL